MTKSRLNYTQIKHLLHQSFNNIFLQVQIPIKFQVEQKCAFLQHNSMILKSVRCQLFLQSAKNILILQHSSTNRFPINMSPSYPHYLQIFYVAFSLQKLYNSHIYIWGREKCEHHLITLFYNYFSILTYSIILTTSVQLVFISINFLSSTMSLINRQSLHL